MLQLGDIINPMIENCKDLVSFFKGSKSDLEGFDVIYGRIPQISLYHVLLFCAASYTIIMSGMSVIQSN